MPPMRYFTVTQTREVRIATSEGLLDAAQHASRLFAGETIPSEEDATKARSPIIDRKLLIEEER